MSCCETCSTSSPSSSCCSSNHGHASEARMDATLVADVVAEVMKRLGGGSGNSRGSGGRVMAGEDEAANDGLAGAPHRISDPVGQFGIFAKVDDAVVAATAAQQKLMALSLDDRDAIVKLIKKIAKDNAEAWGKMELDETEIGRLDHKIEKLKILE